MPLYWQLSTTQPPLKVLRSMVPHRLCVCSFSVANNWHQGSAFASRGVEIKDIYNISFGVCIRVWLFRWWSKSRLDILPKIHSCRKSYFSWVTASPHDRLRAECVAIRSLGFSHQLLLLDCPLRCCGILIACGCNMLAFVTWPCTCSIWDLENFWFLSTTFFADPFLYSSCSCGWWPCQHSLGKLILPFSASAHSLFPLLLTLLVLLSKAGNPLLLRSRTLSRWSPPRLNKFYLLQLMLQFLLLFLLLLARVCFEAVSVFSWDIFYMQLGSLSFASLSWIDNCFKSFY